MKVRNLVLGLMLAANVLTAHSAFIVPHSHSQFSAKTMASTVSSTIINSQNTALVECVLKYERVNKDDEWVGTIVPSLKKTVNKSGCQTNKKAMEQLNGTHYKFGKVKGIFDVRGTDHVMIELVEVNE
jgi:hypothetical protein